MSNVSDTTDSQVFYSNVERALGLNKPNDLNFDPLALLKEGSLSQGMQPTEQVGSNYGFPNVTIGDSNNEADSLGSASRINDGAFSDGTEPTSFVSGDGPPTRIDQHLDAPAVVREAAEPGNAHQIVDLIVSGNFRNPDLSLTPAAMEAIRAAVANTGLFQTYEGRAQEVQDYVNRFVVGGGLSVRFDRDQGNANTRLGSRPSIVFGTGGNGTTRIPLHR